MPGLPTQPPQLSCKACREGAGLDFAISMAFQPIVDVEAKRVFAHEALVRGPNGEGARSAANPAIIGVAEVASAVSAPDTAVRSAFCSARVVTGLARTLPAVVVKTGPTADIAPD